MKVVLENIRVIFPFFIVSWGLFLISMIQKPQRLRNCYLLMLALLFSAVMITGFFGEYMGYAMLYLLLLIALVLFLVPVMLVANGVQVLKKESRTPAHMLSLLLGIAIAIGEISAVASVLSSMEYLVPMKVGYASAFIFASTFYFCIVILAFVLYVLAIQWMPHRMNFDFVIIHGAGLIDGKRISKLLANRIDKAIEIYNKCKIKPVIIPSGGKGADEDLSEAEAMKNYLLEKGIPEDSIIIEDGSTTTMENLENSRKIIEASGKKGRVALVSSNYHIYRCLVYAKKLNMKCTGIGAKVAFYYWPSAVLREFAAVYSQRPGLIWLIIGYAFFVIIPEITIMFS